MRAVVVLTTVSDRRAAKALADGLLKARLAACVTAVGGALSRYRWKGKLETSREILLLVKTSAEKAGPARRFIESHHSYEVPEILTMPAAGASEAYLTWMEENLK